MARDGRLWKSSGRQRLSLRSVLTAFSRESRATSSADGEARRDAARWPSESPGAVDPDLAIGRPPDLVASGVPLPRLSLLPALLVTTGVLVAPSSATERPTTPAEPREESATLAENPEAVPEQDDDTPATEPPAYSETVVVTATRDEEAIVNSVALVTALDADDLAESPGALVDETLARVPGFGLFRRNTSLISHPPTTTGVSLRGLGPSGASRSLVLWDGIPLNDPFGNWVYWNRLPTLLLDRIEVARGGASPLYGSSALGGTIQLFSKSPAPLFQARARAGELGLRDGEVLASHRAGDFGFVGAAWVFDSEGYHRIREAERGFVDEPAGVAFRSAAGPDRDRPGPFRPNYYREDRRNETPTQVNDSGTVLLHGGIVRDARSLNVHPKPPNAAPPPEARDGTATNKEDREQCILSR